MTSLGLTSAVRAAGWGWELSLLEVLRFWSIGRLIEAVCSCSGRRELIKDVVEANGRRAAVVHRVSQCRTQSGLVTHILPPVIEP
jgi:hypothetical protein